MARSKLICYLFQSTARNKTYPVLTDELLQMVAALMPASKLANALHSNYMKADVWRRRETASGDRGNDSSTH